MSPAGSFFEIGALFGMAESSIKKVVVYYYNFISVASDVCFFQCPHFSK